MVGGRATANVADNSLQWLIRQVDGRMIVLSDTAFHAAEGILPTSNCVSGEWEDRMLVETVLSMLTVVCHFKSYARVWAYRLAAFAMAAFNVLVQWYGLPPHASGFVPSQWLNLSVKYQYRCLVLRKKYHWLHNVYATSTLVSMSRGSMLPPRRRKGFDGQ